MIVSAVIIAFALGVFAGNWWASRWIDHRWYCGHRHRASHPCQPTPEHLASWKRMESQLDRAEELEDEAKSLRRRW